MWRWSFDSETTKENVKVFSTYVEVILKDDSATVVKFRILHVCGGDPYKKLCYIVNS